MKNTDESIFFSNEFSRIDVDDISSWNPNSLGIEAGLRGEQKTFAILSKYASKIFRNVVIWSKKRDLITEVDFVCIINGFLVLVESKDWFGKLTSSPTAGKVFLEVVNTKGQFFRHERMNPSAALGGFRDDFSNYLGLKKPATKHIKTFVVFTREDLSIPLSNEQKKSNRQVCHLDDFEEEIKMIMEEQNEESFSLPNELPSWDFYYCEKEKAWYKTALLNDVIKTEKEDFDVSQIKSILFDHSDNRKITIQFHSGAFWEGYAEPKFFRFSSFLKISSGIVRFIILNPLLHKQTKSITQEDILSKRI